MRTYLTAPLAINVNANSGNDATGNASGSPFLTLQAARAYTQQNFDLGYKWGVTFNCTGWFTSGLIAVQPLAGQLNEAYEVWNFAPASVVVASPQSDNCGFLAVNNALLTIQAQNGLTIEAPMAGGVGGAVSEGGILSFANTTTFSNCGFACVQSNQAGQLYLNSFFTTGNCTAFAFASQGTIQFNPGNQGWLVGAPSYAKALLWVHAGGVIGASGTTFNGVYHGIKALADEGGVIEA